MIKIYLFFALFRIVVAVIMRTSFAPDEYFQGPQQAFIRSHSIGTETWEWQESVQLRSYIPIMPFVWLFALLKRFNLDSALILSITPRLLQSLLTAVGDYSLYKLCRLCVDRDKARFVLQCYLFSCINIYCGSRTLINCTETSLILVIMFGLGRKAKSVLTGPGSLPLSILSSTSVSVCAILTSLIIWIRPTSLIILGLTWSWFLFQFESRSVTQLLLSFVRIFIVVAISCCLWCGLDSYWYGQLSIPPYEFVKINWLQNVAVKFGESPWHWYLSQVFHLAEKLIGWLVYCVMCKGFPAMLGIYYPMALLGAYKLRSERFVRLCSALCISATVVLSLASKHKELRFLLPVSPYAHILGGLQLQKWASEKAVSIDSITKQNRKLLVCLNWAINVAVAIFLLYFHQFGAERGALFVATAISNRAGELKLIGDSKLATIKVFELATCYSFPGPTFAFFGLSTEKFEYISPRCSPWDDDATMATRFEASPVLYSRSVIGSHLDIDNFVSVCDHSSPAQCNNITEGRRGLYYVMTFDCFLPQISPILSEYGFVEVAVFQHALFRYDYDDPTFRANVHIFERIDVH